MAAGWYKSASGAPVYMDAGGLVHLQNDVGDVKTVKPEEAHALLADQSLGYVPATEQAVHAAKDQAQWDAASTGKKVEFYSREAAKGAIDTVTALPRAIAAGGKMLATAINPDAAEVANPLEATSGEKVVEKIDSLLGNTQQGIAANVAEQRKFGEVNPGTKTALNLAGNVAGLVATGGLGEAGGLLTGGKLFGEAGIAARAAGTAVEGAAQNYAVGAEDAWQKDQDYTTESQWAHMGIGGLLGGAGSVAVDAARGVGRLASRKAIEAAEVFGPSKAASVAENIGRSGDAAAAAIEDILQVPPAPGAVGKLRKLLNEAQGNLEEKAAAKLGISSEEIAAGVKPLSAEERNLASAHPAAVRKGTDDLTEALTALHEESKPILLEDTSLELKRDNIKHLMTGDEATMREVAEAKAAEFEATLERVKAVSSSKGEERSLFGSGAASKDLRFAYQDAIDGLRNADHPADIAVALDSFKREIGKVKTRAETVARSAASGEAQKQALARSDLAAQVYSDTKTLLEDSTVWGKFGDAQRTKNSRWSRMLDSEDFVQPQLNRQMGTLSGAENFGRARYVVDPAKVESYLNGLGTNRSKLLDNALRDNIVAKKDLAASLVDLYGLGQHTAGLQKMQGASEKALSLLKELDRSVAATNQVNAVHEAMSMLQKNSTDYGAVGAVAGSLFGPGGAAVGGALGKAANLANPVNMLRQFVSFRHTAAKTADLMQSAIESSLFKTAAAGATTAGRVAVKAASRAGGYSVNDYTHAATAVSKLQGDPIIAAKAVADDTAHIEHPETRDAMQMVGARLNNFLASKLPKPLYAAPNSTDAIDNVSATAKDQFMRYVNAANDPLAIFRDIKSGTASAEQAETLQACFPALYAKAQYQTAQAFMTGKVKASFQVRQHMQRIFGLQIDPMMSPALQSFVKDSVEQSTKQQQSQQSAKPSRGAPSASSALQSPLSNLKV